MRRMACAACSSWRGSLRLSVHAALFAEPRSTVIGTSQDGAPLTLYQLGEGPKRVLLIGGQHGGPEAKYGRACQRAARLLQRQSGGGAAWHRARHSARRQSRRPGAWQFGSSADGVDPDRNWGGGDWKTDAYDSNAVFRAGLGGPEPFSAPETQALANWVLANRPTFIVNYHSAGGFMFGARDGLAGELSSSVRAGERRTGGRNRASADSAVRCRIRPAAA